MWRYLPGIETKYGIGIESFAACNPYVGASCTNLWLGYYVCVDATATGTTTTSSSATAPSPLEPSTDTKCTKWHLVVSGDTCQNIETAYDITASQVSRCANKGFYALLTWRFNPVQFLESVRRYGLR